ncbi:gamma-glutamyltransferase family protein [Microbacterium oleivorans]|uniref:gamma-glutamyltransferase family protein n=1 Tax=Microbacterium oleivorans TaxID=273677 RepID=UPI002041F00B|nr:gamma-glutamyltransferase [Microbacterium oleivorans]MCM3696255.1 gamma-glutamyltransferase family protein [Microbacterium oleivorans]
MTTAGYTAPSAFTTRPQLTGTFGMAASTHATATAVAMAVLERGGNAFDAACAGGFVLHIVEPHLNGPGGDLVGLFQPADAPTPTVLMGQGAAPAGATIAHFRREGLDLVPGAGGLAAAIPAAVDAWLLLLRDHGTWSVADVLSFAIDYAEAGHPLLPAASATIGRVADLFRDHWPASAELWMPDGSPADAGTLHRNPAYAAVLRRLAAAGADRGDRVAAIDAARSEWRELLGDACEVLADPHRHSSGTDHAAVLTREDLVEAPARYEQPLSVAFRGRRVFKADAWSQGPALLAALRIMVPLPDDLLDPSTTAGAHTLVETLKLVLADRDASFGDGADAGALLTDEVAADRRADLGARASSQWRPARRADTDPWTPPLRRDVAAAAGTGEPTVDRSGSTRGDTCHIDVADRWGNVVSVTPSGGWLQSSPTIPSLGFCLGTRLQMCWLDEHSPAALRPGARPRTTLSPTLVHDGDTRIALGTPGGDQQDQWQLPMLLRMFVGGYTAQQAIDAPTLHTTAMVDSFWPRTWDPTGVVAEDRLGEEVLRGLSALGHTVSRAGDWALGRLSAVGADRATGILWAAANPRGVQGYAAGR